MKTPVKSEDSPTYISTTPTTSTDAHDDAIIAEALSILERRLADSKARNIILTSPESVMDYLRLSLCDRPQEVFTCLFLDNRHKLIKAEEMFYGTIDGASVHPREVLRRALELRSAAVIFAHNHPSGEANPSNADFRITQRLKDALAMIDVRVLDHFIIGNGKPYSFAEHGTL